jgi:hypothetical protein
VKPFGPVSRETISRWLKTVMSLSGMYPKSYSSHIITSAIVYMAYQNAIPVEKILQRAGLTNARTFAKYYKKPIGKSRLVINFTTSFHVRDQVRLQIAQTLRMIKTITNKIQISKSLLYTATQSTSLFTF